jgi:putative transposase
VVTPEDKRTVVGFWRSQHRISERRACRLIALCRATQRYMKRPERRPELRVRLRELAAQRRRFGYRRLHTMLEREGVMVNVKRVRRLYREERLSLRQRGGRRRYRGVRVIAALPTRVNQRWSMDFMTDALADGRRFRGLNVVDDFSRECLASEPGRSLTGRQVVEVLHRLIAQRGAPETILSDNVLNASGLPSRGNSNPDRLPDAIDLLNSGTAPSASGLPRLCRGALPDHSGHKIQRVLA